MPEQLRVLHLITELRPAGAERIVYELARGLPKDQFHVQVASLRPATGATAQWLLNLGIPIHDLGMKFKYDFRSPIRLYKLLRREKIDILHTHLFHANFLGRWVARTAAVRTLGTVHIAERRFSPWRFWMERWALGRDGILVCVSSSVREFMMEKAKIPEHKLRVIWNGIDVSRFDAWQGNLRRCEAAKHLRNVCGTPTHAKIAIAVGRLEDQKNHSMLLRAWQQVSTKSSSAFLAVVGDGSGLSRLKSLAKDLNICECVRWLGHRDDVPALLAGADVFVSSSSYEGFGLAVAEAMASGVPVAATAVPSVCEVLGEQGAGILVPLDDESELGKAISALLSVSHEERIRIGGIGRRRALERFSKETMIANYASLYSEIMKTGYMR